MAILATEAVGQLTRFFLSHLEDELLEVMRAPEPAACYDVQVSVMQLLAEEPTAGAAVLSYPQTVLEWMSDALREAQLAIMTRSTSADQLLIAKQRVYPRPFDVPLDPNFSKINVSSLRSSDVGLLISLNATVTRVGATMMREVERNFRCNKCKHEFSIIADITQKGGAFIMPPRCPSEWEKPCTCSSFSQEGDMGLCRDYQEIKVQEKVKTLEMGSIPRSMLVVLQDSLVDKCKPGDDLVLTGILHRRWNRGPTNDSRCDIEMMLEAVHLKLNNENKAFQHVSETDAEEFDAFWARFREQPLVGRNAIVRSLCPQIFGLDMVKLIVAMSIIGGCPRKDVHGTRVRGESHLLIVGDPGTAKSQILRYAAKLVPRVVLTTGIGTTSAGLTVTAVRDSTTGDWMLDAGALVLADGGLCCIDEFGGIREQDRGAIHEAMEQQTISVAKAGLVCTLDTRATVFAAMNPKAGKLAADSARAGQSVGSLPVHLAVASPLLSRFDVVLTLLDQQDAEWDKTLSSFLLESRIGGKVPPPADPTFWSTDKLRLYFHYVKSNVHPDLSPDAERLLSQYYTVERSAELRNAARTTVRLLEALIRLTQAHARLMLRRLATPQDAIFAIAAVESSAVTTESLGKKGTLQAGFPEDPEADYEDFAKFVLVKLGLEGDIDIWEGYDSFEVPKVSTAQCNPREKENFAPRSVAEQKKPQQCDTEWDDLTSLPGSQP